MITFIAVKKKMCFGAKHAWNQYSTISSHVRFIIIIIIIIYTISATDDFMILLVNIVNIIIL